MLERLPEQRNGPAMADHGECHHATAVPQDRGIERQMQGLAWLLPVLDRPEHQRAVERCRIDPLVGEPTPAAALPPGGQAMDHRELGLPVVETDGLAQQQPGDHPARQRQMALVADGAVLTEKAGQLSMEPGMGIHEGLVWCENPKLSRLSAHPMG